MACAFMVIPMLLRLDHYMVSHASHQKHMRATRWRYPAYSFRQLSTSKQEVLS